MALKPIDLPDFVRAFMLLGKTDDDEMIPVLIDADGQLNILVRGVDDAATVRTVKVDDAGQLYAILRGADDVDVAVDGAGFLSALVKGIDGGAVLRTLAVDTSGQLVMVPRGQSGNYMAIDASGYMTAVLKGIYSGVLNTIAVDASGRLEAFGLDGEDQWNQVLKTGNCDLAARLGSPMTWDWRGSLLYAHDFSTGRGPIVAATDGAGGAVALGPEYAGFGGYALKMTSGSDGDAYARAQLAVGANPSPRVGVAYRLSIDGNGDNVEVMIERMQGAGSPWAFARLDIANKVVQVLDHTSTWRTLGTVAVNLYAYCYSWFKVVIDQDTGYYERVQYNDQEFDASAWQYPTISPDDNGTLLYQLVWFGRVGYNDVLYLDQIIVTVNEPENA